MYARKFFKFLLKGPSSGSLWLRIISIFVRAILWIVIIFGFGRTTLDFSVLFIKAGNESSFFQSVLPANSLADSFRHEIIKRKLRSSSLVLREIFHENEDRIEHLYGELQALELTPEEKASISIGANIYGKRYAYKDIDKVVDSISRLNSSDLTKLDFIHEQRYILMNIALDNLALMPSNYHVWNDNVVSTLYFYIIFGNQGVVSRIPHKYDYASALKIVSSIWPLYEALKMENSISVKDKVKSAYSIYLIARYSNGKYDFGFPGYYARERCDDELQRYHHIISHDFDSFSENNKIEGFHFNSLYKVTRQTYWPEKAKICKWF